MLYDFFRKVKGFLLHPAESFRRHRDEDFSEAFKYFLILLTVIIALYQLFSLFMTVSVLINYSGMKGLMIGVLIISFIVGVIMQATLAIGLLFVSALIVHLFVILTGGKKGFLRTLAAIIYSSTPFIVIAIIISALNVLPQLVPSVYLMQGYWYLNLFISLIGFIWWNILEILAIREFQELSTKNATIAIILTVIAYLIIIGVLLGCFLMIIFLSTNHL